MRDDPSTPPIERASARELLLFCAAAAALFAFALRGALFDPSQALLGAGDGEFVHAALRFLARNWLAGEAPLWNPHVAAGAPACGNPLLGVLDPQSLASVAVHGAFGESAATWSLALLAWIRLVAGATGAFVLARALGMRGAGAWIAGLSFGGAGVLALHAVEPSGRVALFVPWVLVALERVRASSGARGAIAVALATSLSIYAGHPEAAFWLGLLASAWIVSMWREDARAGRTAALALFAGVGLSAPVLAPFGEYLMRSSVLRTRAAATQGLDPLDVGALLIVVGAVWRARQLAARLDDDPRRRQRFAAGLAVALALLAVLVAALAPWPRSAALALLPDLYGRGADFWGEGEYVQHAYAWLAPLALAAAFAALLATDSLGLRRARMIRIVAVVALLLALRVPGAVQIAHALPFSELSDTSHCAAVAALLVSLLAGAGFERAPNWARWTAASTHSLCVGAIVLAASQTPEPPAPEWVLDAPDGLVELVHAPSEALARGDVVFEGWIHPELEVESAAVRLVAGPDVERAAHELPMPLELSSEPWRSEDAERAPANATWFRARSLHVRDLPDGGWGFALVLRGAEGRELTERMLAGAVVHRPARPGAAWIALAFSSAFALAWLRPRGAPAWIAVALVAASIAWFHEGAQRVKPADELFRGPVDPERVLAEAGEGRVMSADGVLGEHAALAHGWRAADARDGMGVAQFDAARALALPHGAHPSASWNAHGLDLDAPLARLLDVRVLAREGAFVHPAWARTADATLLWRTRAPLGVASCVPQVVNPEWIARDPRDFDPATEAYTSDDSRWAPHKPFENAEVALVRRSASEVEFRARLDGDGLLVFTEQLFPGWSVSVDGEPARLLAVDTLFQGVALSAGESRVVFRYRPGSLRVGVFLALLSTVALAWLARRSATDRATTPA